MASSHKVNSECCLLEWWKHSQHREAAGWTHGEAATKPQGAPGRLPAAAPSAASSSPPQSPTGGGAELLTEGGRRRRLQGLTKPDGATRRYL